MREYYVTITETHCRRLYIEAESADDARDIVETRWESGRYVLDADDLDEVNFDVEDITEKVLYKSQPKRPENEKYLG